MNVFYIVENINEFFIFATGMASALAMLTCSVFCFPKDES